MKFLGIDVGTTMVKGQLYSEDGQILEYISREYDFLQENGEKYIDVVTIKRLVFEIIKTIAAKHTITAIAFSSLGEAFVALDEKDNILTYPMLYTDPRGKEETVEVLTQISAAELYKITGTTAESMYSLYKLLWIKNHRPKAYQSIDKIMLICDYMGYCLTGERYIDYGLAARTGAFDIEKKVFSTEILKAFEINEKWFSTPVKAGSRIGNLLPSVKEELGISYDMQVVCGSHDQICSALGAGVTETGSCVDGMGTVECINAVFDKKVEEKEVGAQGYSCVPYALDGSYCTYILNYTCGAAVNWFKKKIVSEYVPNGENFFSYYGDKLTSEPSGILCLPYFAGASTPYCDIDAKAAFLNVTLNTTSQDLYKSILEGTAFEMRLNVENLAKYGVKISSLIATGGGSNSDAWLQIKADIMRLPIKQLSSKEAGICGCVMLCAVACGLCKDLTEASKRFVKYGKEYLPNKENALQYDGLYAKYKNVYKAVKEFY